MKKETKQKKVTGYDWEAARLDNHKRNQPKPMPRAAMNGNK